MFLSNSVDMMKNLLRQRGKTVKIPFNWCNKVLYSRRGRIWWRRYWSQALSNTNISKVSKLQSFQEVLYTVFSRYYSRILTIIYHGLQMRIVLEKTSNYQNCCTIRVKRIKILKPNQQVKTNCSFGCTCTVIVFIFISRVSNQSILLVTCFCLANTNIT